MKRHVIILPFFVLLTIGVAAQRNVLRESLVAYQEKNYVLARDLLDSAWQDSTVTADYMSWYYRGFIYKDFYKTQEVDDKQSKTRITGLESFVKFLEMAPPGNENVESAVKGVRFLASSLYNDAATSIDKEHAEESMANYALYKDYIRKIDPSKDFKEQDINYYLVLGAMYSQVYDLDRARNKDYFDKAISSYQFVLDIDPDNLSGNYNMGILYYNEAVGKIKSMDYDTDIITLELIQDECVNLFQKALPYMQRAYELNPKRKATLTGLAGIYFSLNEMEKSEAIKQELKELNGGE